MKKFNIELNSVLILTSKFSEVKRSIGYRVRHLENDAEHSYQLAMAVWAINKKYNLKLDESKLFKLALVHDLVEIYAGDVDAHGKTGHKEKKENEKKALLKLKKNYPELNFIFQHVSEYEEKKTLESLLVNMVDKAIPDKHIYRLGGNYYKKRKVTIDDWESWYYEKTRYEKLPKSLKKIADDMADEIRTNFKKMFYKG